MSARSGILCGGNWIVDKLKIIDTYPQQDTLANIMSESVGNGGSPFNVLIDLAKLGVNFPLAGVGLVGRDSNGEWIAEQCKIHGIDISKLQVHGEASTSYTDVMTVKSTGRRTFFHQRGANAFLEPSHFDFAASNAKIFHLGYLLLLDRLDSPDGEYGTLAARVLHDAGKAGMKTSVDVVSEDSSRFRQIVLPALRHVDYCMLNEFEIERTTGVVTRVEGLIDLAAVELASQKLLAAGVRDLVVVHFPEGATALGSDGIFQVLGSLTIPQSEIVSTVGAGDAFAAGVLLGLHENVPIKTALRYGIAAAASSLLGAGTSDSVALLASCLELENRYKIRQNPGVKTQC